MKPNFLAGAILTALLFSPALPADVAAKKIQTYVLDIQNPDVHCQVTLIVEQGTTETVVTYQNEFNDKEITAFTDQTHIERVEYLDPQNAQTGTVLYDYAKKKIVIAGDNNATYRMTDNAYENNGSMFYLFALKYPEPEKPFVFYLTQGNMSRIHDPLQRFLLCKLIGPVEMYLKYLATEPLEIFGDKYQADHYELGIHDRRLAPFWPHTYHFWYTREAPRHLLKYQGINAKHNQETILFVDKYERDTEQDVYPNIDLKR